MVGEQVQTEPGPSLGHRPIMILNRKALVAMVTGHSSLDLLLI